MVFLTCSASISVFNDGNSRDLMSLAGTIPVSYRGNRYIYDFDNSMIVIVVILSLLLYGYSMSYIFV